MVNHLSFTYCLLLLLTLADGQFQQQQQQPATSSANGNGANGQPRQSNPFLALSASTASSSDLYKYCYPRDTRGYSYPLGQRSPNGPVPLSMSSLISMMEKLESSTIELRDPVSMARWLLSRFRVDDLVYYGGSLGYRDFNQDPNSQRRAEILSIPLRLREAPVVYNNDLLSDDQACLLYFMLSHTVNRTQNRPTREMGVVSVNHHTSHAVSPGRLLISFLLIASSPGQIETSEILAELVRNDVNLISQFNSKSRSLNPTYLSLADLWAGGVLYDTEVPLDAKRFGASGEWMTNSSFNCPIEYRLARGNSRSIGVSKGSLAEMRGAIDGILMAKKYVELTKSMSSSSSYSARLSSVLRQYYSADGFGDQYTSYCSRSTLQGELSSGLRDQAKGYLALLLTRIKNSVPYDNDFNYFIDTTASDFEGALQESQRPIDDDVCANDFAPKPTCETPVDATLVLDLDNEFEKQVEIVSKLATTLNTWKWGSSINLVTGTRGGGIYSSDSYSSPSSSDGLSRISWNSTDASCTLCRLSYLDRNNFGGTPVAPDQLLRLVNQTLRDIQLGKSSLSGAPARPLVIFNFGSARRSISDQRSFDSAHWDLRYGHRETSIFIVGKDRDTPDYMRWIASDVIDAQAPDVTGIVRKLVSKMCQSSLVLQYPDCRREPSSGYSYTGYVSPSSIVHVAMFPEQFIKSYNIEFEISSPTSTPLKVCYRRGSPLPNDDERNCAKLDKEPIIYHTKNPCYRYGLHDCPAFYWTIEASDQTASSNGIRCRDERCASLNQIPFKISHSGITCSSAISSLGLSLSYHLILSFSTALVLFMRL